eukprot:364210-Chlamydomonas_euryale.AAC.6
MDAGGGQCVLLPGRGCGDPCERARLHRVSARAAPRRRGGRRAGGGSGPAAGRQLRRRRGPKHIAGRARSVLRGAAHYVSGVQAAARGDRGHHARRDGLPLLRRHQVRGAGVRDEGRPKGRGKRV